MVVGGTEGFKAMLPLLLAYRLALIFENGLPLRCAEPGFRRISLPANGMAMTLRRLYACHHTVKRYVHKAVAELVIGRFENEFMAERVVAEAGKGLVFARQTDAMSKFKGRVFGAKHEQCARQVSYIVV